MENNPAIKFVGLEKTQLKPDQVTDLKEIAAQEAAKLQRYLDEDFNIAIHLKEYGKESKQQRYLTYLKIISPGQVLTSDRSQMHSWDVVLTLKKAFSSIKHKIEKDAQKNG